MLSPGGELAIDSEKVIMFSLEDLAPSVAGPVVFAMQTREMSHPAWDSGVEPAGDDLGCFTPPALTALTM